MDKGNETKRRGRKTKGAGSRISVYLDYQTVRFLEREAQKAGVSLPLFCKEILSEESQISLAQLRAQFMGMQMMLEEILLALEVNTAINQEINRQIACRMEAKENMSEEEKKRIIDRSLTLISKSRENAKRNVVNARKGQTNEDILMLDSIEKQLVEE